MMRLQVISIAILVLSTCAVVSGRHLLHKHHSHHGHDEHHHGHHHGGGQCRTISEVVNGAPNLKRFSEALKHARVPFLDGLFNDGHSRATFLAVPDEYLGTGDTVFAEATARFLQHTVMDRVKICKVKDGEMFQTLLGPKLRVVRDTSGVAGRSGRKLADVTGWAGNPGSLSTAWGALLDQLPALSASAAAASSSSSSSGGGQAAASSQTASHARPHPEQHEHDRHGPHGPHGPHGDDHHSPHHGPHHGPHGPHEHDEHHHGPHGHGEHHGRWHPHWRHHRHGRHGGRSVESMVEHAFARAERKAAKHGDLYLELDTTSQRIKVLATVRACEGEVLFVSGFLNPPPDPEPVLAAAHLQLTELAAQSAVQQEQPHRFHHHGHHHRHRHGFLHKAKHALEHAFDGLRSLFGYPPIRHAHCKHGSRGRRFRHGSRRHEPVFRSDDAAVAATSFDSMSHRHAINYQAGKAVAAALAAADGNPVLRAIPARIAAAAAAQEETRAATDAGSSGAATAVPMELVDVGASADGMEWFEIVPVPQADSQQDDLPNARAGEATEALPDASDESVAQA